MGKEYVRKNVLFVRSAPHEWLFPRCSAIVHHGGSGTTAAALRSSRPSVITPVWIDQYANAKLIADNGAGIALPQFQKVTVAALSGALKKCAGDKEMQTKCAEVAAKLKEEKGVEAATEEIKRVLAEEVGTGKWKQKLDERKEELRKHKHRSPGFLGWVGRICCSGTYNDYV